MVNKKKTKILIVDDDVITRLMLRKVLSKYGFEVFEESDGKEGFFKYIKVSPDLILMDVMMPVMGGYAATAAIRNYEENRVTPIIMLTALDDIQSVDKAFNAGATDFITKPLNWGLLVQRIKNALKSAKIEQDLLASQQRLDYAIKIAKLGYWEWSAKTNHITASKSAFDLMSVPYQTEISLENFISNIIPKDITRVHQALSEANYGVHNLQLSFRIKKLDRSVSHIDCLGDAFFDNKNSLVKITGSIQDISRLHKAESLIDYQANYDKLTQLPNRSFFSKTLEKSFINKNINSSTISATIVLDIDRFKAINDSFGQEQGDSLLCTVAQRIKNVTREGDFIARLGSDEFAIIIKEAKDLAELNLSLNRLFKDLSKVYIINNQELNSSFSMGVAVKFQDGKTSSELISNANIARSQAKKQGGNQFQFYQKEMSEESKSMLLLENDLYKALEKDEIEVYFQPQVNAQTLKPCGAEALVRWNHKKHGIISPIVFIPIAESTGLIVSIGQYIIQKSVLVAEKWHKMGFDDLHIGINLSGRQFSHDNLMDVILKVLNDSSLPAKYLDLEITESLAMSNADHNISILKDLKALGVSLSIDDFGTGYSSLAYLHSFPIDTIKIDRSFILNLETKEGQAIINTILAMAKSLNLKVVAEGIEENSHVEYLQSKNCDIFQGYKFGKPMSESDFDSYLINNRQTKGKSCQAQ